MELALLSGLTFMAAVLGTLTGFGISTLMVPILALFLPLPVVLLYVGIIHWCGDVWKILLFRQGIRWRWVFWFGVPAIITAYFGATLVLAIPQEPFLRILGIVLVTYVGSFVIVPHALTVHPNTATALLGGGVSGFCMGLFGFGGEMRAMFLTLYRLPKEVYIATIGAIAIVTDTTRIGVYWMQGVRVPDYLLYYLLALIPISFVAALVARRLVHRLPEQKFRALVLVALLFIGLKLIIAP